MANNNDETANNGPATRAEQIVMCAISTVDFTSCANIDEAEKTVLQRISTVERFLNPKSTIMKVAEAVRIMATIDRIEFEESSTRYRIFYTPDVVREGQDDKEEIRSDRTDSKYYGQKVTDMWTALAPGDHVCIYKIYEETGKTNAPRVRIAPYVQKVPKRH